MAAEAALGSVIETVTNLVIEEVKFLAGVSEEVEELQRELECLQSFLRDAQARKNEKRDIQVWIAQARDVAYEAEDLVEEYAFRISSQKKSLFKRMGVCFLNECPVRQSIGSDIKKLKTRILNTTRRFKDYGISSLLNGKEDSSSSSQHEFRRTYSHFASDDFIKLDNDVDMLMEHLVNESDDDLHKIVSVFGMGGLGKTTLARKVYNHPRIQGHFDNLAWVCISQQWKKTEILQGILIKFFDRKREEIVKWLDEELMRELSQTFKNKKCLVVLDDIWSSEVWESIKEAFPLKKNKSKILLTTRNRNVALHIAPNGLHHEPRLLNDAETWELLQIKAFVKEPEIDDEQMSEMEVLGKEMVKYCGGLPLAVIVLRGILARKRDIDEWKNVHKNVKAHIGRGEDNNEGQGEVKKILTLSYNDLPLKFKPCFLYLSRYPEDSEIDAEILYQLWISEGMILGKDQIGDESMMDVAERYLKELEERSLVEVVVDVDKMRMTKLKSCRLHDLVRDMSLEKAKEENFFSSVHSRNGFEDQVYKSCSLTNKIHRLDIHLDKDASKYVPPSKRTTKHLRSLKLVMDITDYKEPITRTIHCHVVPFQMLRSLEIMVSRSESLENLVGAYCLKSIDSYKLSTAFGNLIHLRYLSMGGYLFFPLPSSIGNLKQLETLDLRDVSFLQITNMVWKMTQLKQLYLPTNSWEVFAPEKLKFEGLNKLEIFEGFDSSYCCFEDLAKLPNLRWFTATIHMKDDNLDLICSLNSKGSIKINSSNVDFKSSRRRINLNCSCFDPKDDESIDLSTLMSDKDDDLGIVEMDSTELSKLFSCEKILKLETNVSIDNLPNYSNGLASNLVELNLRESKLKGNPMEMLGKLLNLKYLFLGRKSFMGTKMDCDSTSFLQLRRLQFWYLPNFKEWTIAQGAMLNLSVLQIFNCKELEMIPDGLIFVKTLTKLQVEWMPENFNKRIQVIDGQEGEDYYKIKHVPTVKVDSFNDLL